MSTPPKPGYKQTEVGAIPDDWSVSPLGRLISSVEYGSSSKSNPQGLMPVLRMGNIQDGKINWDDLVFTDADPEIKKYTLHPGEVLFNRTNTIDLVGKTAIYKGERSAIFAGYLIRISVNTKLLNSQFLTYVLNAEFSKTYSAKVLSIAVGQANINGQKLKTYPIPLPPTKTEQDAIAEAVNDAENLTESLEKLIAKKRDLKQAAMQELLTGERRLHGFTGEWQTYRIGDLFKVLRNASYSRSELAPEGEVAYVHYGDIHTHNSAFLDVHSKRSYISRQEAGGTPRLADGDLLMVDASEDTTAIGKAVEVTGLYNAEAIAGLHTMALRADKSLLVDGYKGYLQFLPDLKAALVRLATGVSVYGITKSGVKAIEITIPPPPEQREIASILNDMDAEFATLEQRLEKTRALKQGMIQELLTGRIRLV